LCLYFRFTALCLWISKMSYSYFCSFLPPFFLKIHVSRQHSKYHRAVDKTMASYSGGHALKPQPGYLLYLLSSSSSVSPGKYQGNISKLLFHLHHGQVDMKQGDENESAIGWLMKCASDCQNISNHPFLLNTWSVPIG
jgi:hypothetical protein